MYVKAQFSPGYMPLYALCWAEADNQQSRMPRSNEGNTYIANGINASKLQYWLELFRWYQVDSQLF